MSPSRFALVPWFLLLLSRPCEREEIVFRVAADTTLVRTLKNEYSMQLDSMTVSLDGEEVPSDQFGDFDVTIQHHESYVVTDAFEAVADGLPRRLRRTFDELSGGESSTFSMDGEDSTDSSDYESELDGRTVLFTWNEESGSFDAAFAGDGGDEEMLEDLVEDMDLRRFLPPGPRAEGESWSIEPRAFECILDPGGELGLEDPEDEGSDSSVEDAELRENIDGKITATFQGVRVEGGVKQAVIALACETSTHANQELAPDEIPEGTRGTGRVEIRFVLEGELRWDLEHGHALSFELSGENELTTIQTISGDIQGEPTEQTQKMVFSGETSFSMKVERR